MNTTVTAKTSIRKTLLTTMLGLIACLLAILTPIQIYYQKQLLELELDRRVGLMRENLIDRGKILSEYLVQQARSNIAEYNFSNLNEQLQNAIEQTPELAYTIILDGHRIAYIHTRDTDLKSRLLQLIEHHTPDHRHQGSSLSEIDIGGANYQQFHYPIQFQAGIWGYLVLGFSQERLNREIVASQQEIRGQVRDMITRTMLTTLIFIVLAALIVIFLANTLSIPLIRLTESARRLATGDFAVTDRIDIDATNEVGVLAVAFTEMATRLKDYSQNLEEKVMERTQALSQALTDLKTTQKQLIESEKMAALGDLVAGVAHEINTPVGIGVTAASTFTDDIQTLESLYGNQQMKRQDLERFIASSKTSNRLILANLSRAAELIQSFKQVAVDQTSEEMKTFHLKKSIEDTVLSLKPKLRKTHVELTVEGDEDLELHGYPGFYSQIIANLTLNSLMHAFDTDDRGQIKIAFSRTTGTLSLVYSDDGKGMDDEVRKKIFDPFFTTRKNAGGSGLGLHIVYNLVHQNLKGTIQCSSQPGQGATFTIEVQM